MMISFSYLSLEFITLQSALYSGRFMACQKRRMAFLERNEHRLVNISNQLVLLQKGNLILNWKQTIISDTGLHFIWLPPSSMWHVLIRQTYYSEWRFVLTDSLREDVQIRSQTWKGKCLHTSNLIIHDCTYLVTSLFTFLLYLGWKYYFIFFRTPVRSLNKGRQWVL